VTRHWLRLARCVSLKRNSDLHLVLAADRRQPARVK
jgi:hypothetical protein